MRKLIQAALLTLALTASVYAGEMGQPIAAGEIGQPVAAGDFPFGVSATGDIPNDVTTADDIPFGVPLLNLVLILL
ncbi:MAG TPA: hypothetical protein VF544_02570 [Pyrinomonadaceae bacterium]